MTGSAVSGWLLVGVTALAGGVLLLALAPVSNQLASNQPLLSEESERWDESALLDVAVTDEALVATTSPLVTSSYERLWFLGDVMLSRQVGQFARERGWDFPWRGIVAAIEPRDAVLINFEACLSATKQFDWGQPMRFPVDPAALQAVASSGVTHASLANNHGLDCGAADLEFTRSTMRAVGITAIGHPSVLGGFSVATTTVGGLRVGIVAFHTLFSEPDLPELERLVAQLKTESDLLVAFIHWGNEYEVVAHEGQRELAQTLSRYGFNLVVGHHPHVVQDIEWVGETMVVYSLGNFIFDQYFSPEVQHGLALLLEVEPTPRLRLVPVSSLAVRTQPAVLEGLAKLEALRELASRSAPELRTAIEQGVLPVRLATSTKPGMIAP